LFFFEKKNQKTFIYCVRFRRLRDSQSKVFCFFSSEKKTFFFLTFVPPVGNFQFVPSQDVIARPL